MATNLSQEHPWFEICHSRPTAKYQVFIFPGAGNAGSNYYEWDKDFPDYEFSLVIYPGRGSRFYEEFITTIKEYINQLDKGLLPYITKPCIFIGHSLGTVISFALAKHMVDKKEKVNLLQFMVQMGKGPPHLPDPDDKPIADTTDAEIVEDMKKMADPSLRSVFDEPSYIQMMIPMIRADSRAAEELLEETLLDFPIIVYGGEKEENVKEPFLNRWKELTNAKDLFHVRMFDGHHNFQLECEKEVLQCLKEDFHNLIRNSK